MATIMDEFVNVHPGDQGCRALLGSNEIDGKQEYQPAKNRPG